MKLASCFFCVAVLCSSLATSASAALVTWTFTDIVNTGSAQANMGTGFLANNGTLIFAENSGGAATTFDGISFAAGSFSVGGVSGNAFHANDPILDSGTFGTNGNGSNAGGVDVSIGNDSVASTTNDIGVSLIAGDTYRIQLVIADGRGNAAARSIEIDGMATDHAQGTSGVTWGNSLLATGTFVADNNFQVFNSQLFNGGTPRNDTQFNAIVIHHFPVPEPSSLSILGLGALGLLGYRRRR